MALPRPPARYLKLAASALFVLTCLLAYRQHLQRPSIHILDSSFASTAVSGPIQGDSDAISLCTSTGFATLPLAARQTRKIYDLFLLSTELDWLEIRLHTLSPYVDYFVIIESPNAFTNRPKPLYLNENWDRFAAFHSKIIHRVIENPGPEMVAMDTWAREEYFRNAMFTAVFPSLVDEQAPTLGDVLLVSDVDEIPKPLSLAVLRNCDTPARLTLRSHFYYYSFQWLHRGEQWPHPQATLYDGLENTILPNDLRQGRTGKGQRSSWIGGQSRQKAELMNAAWHCSSCFATLAEMQRKLESFSHTKWNTPENHDANKIAERVRNGDDLFGRAGELYDRVEGNSDVPGFILGEKERFGYLLDRDGEGAGFLDWVGR